MRISWLWFIVAALNSVLLVCDIMAGTPTCDARVVMGDE